MKHRSRFVRLVLAAVVAIGGLAGVAHANPTTIAASSSTIQPRRIGDT